MPDVRVACVQLNAPDDPAAAIAGAVAGIRQAAATGASLVATPENTGFIAQGRKAVLARAEPEDSHRGLATLRALAADLGIHLLVGSLAIAVEPERVANRSYFIGPDGAIRARYDKIHMFDVDLDGGESYRESATFRPGERAVLTDSPWGPIGLTVCYDVRFPHLYRRLAQAGARLLTVPSAFTRPTGQAHWHILLRARAIESGCFVIAPAQTGEHHKGRKTYGHSLIVAPWGEVLADGGEEPGVVTADLDLDQIDRARKMVPSLGHDREMTGPEGAKA